MRTIKAKRAMVRTITVIRSLLSNDNIIMLIKHYKNVYHYESGIIINILLPLPWLSISVFADFLVSFPLKWYFAYSSNFLDSYMYSIFVFPFFATFTQPHLSALATDR